MHRSTKFSLLSGYEPTWRTALVTYGKWSSPNYGSEGWGFESLRARKKALVTSLAGAF